MEKAPVQAPSVLVDGLSAVLGQQLAFNAASWRACGLPEELESDTLPGCGCPSNREGRLARLDL
jgi:hypothetical protein